MRTLNVGGRLIDFARAQPADVTRIQQWRGIRDQTIIEAGGGTYYLDGTRVSLDPTMTLGKGGEADVYRIDPATALKVFKGPDHPDILSDPDHVRLAHEARRRIEEQQKKLRAFPSGLPDHVITPKSLAVDDKGRIAGYTMSLVPGARELLQVHRDKELRKKIKGGSLVKLFLRLHALVAGVHKAGAVIGDSTTSTCWSAESTPTTPIRTRSTPTACSSGRSCARCSPRASSTRRCATRRHDRRCW